MIRLVFTLLMFVIMDSSLGQGSGSISGNVRDNETGVPLQGVEVLIEPINTGNVTDLQGIFRFSNLQAGKYTLTYKHLSYQVLAQKVNLREDEHLVVDIGLHQASHALPGVEITDTILMAEYLRRLPYIGQVAVRDQIRSASTTDIGEYLKQIPNVSGIRKSGSTIDPVVRGFKFSQLTVITDNGIFIEGGCPNRMDPAMSHVELEDIQQIEVLKGPYTLRYGPSFGGVINLSTIQPKAGDHFETHADIYLGYSGNPVGSKEHLSIYGGNKTVFFNFSGNNKGNEDYTDGNGNIVKAKSHKYNIKGQLGVRISPKHQLVFSYNRAFGRGILFPALPMDEREDNTYIASLDYSWKEVTNSLKYITLKIYRSDVDHLMDNKNRSSSDTIVAVTHVDALTNGLRTEAGWQKGIHRIFFGADFQDIRKDGQRNKSAILQPTLPEFVEQIWNNAKIRNAGLFAEYHTHLWLMDWILAMRLDYNEANSEDIIIKKMNQVIYSRYDNASEYFNMSLSMGFYKDLGDHFSAGIMLGRGVRSPDMVERYITLLPVGFDNFDYLGNPGLKPEKIHEIDMTARYDHPGSGSGEINLFYSWVTDFISGVIVPPSEQKPLSNGVLGVKRFANIRPVLFSGFEVSYKTPDHLRWRAGLTAAYTRATVTSIERYVLNEEGQVIGMEEVKSDPLLEIPPFETTLNLGYKLLKNRLVPGVSLRYAAAQNYVSTAFYEHTTPGFFIAGFSVRYTWKSTVSLNGGVNNIFNKAYYEHLNRRIIGSDANFYEPGRNFYINLILNL